MSMTQVKVRISFWYLHNVVFTRTLNLSCETLVTSNNL